MPTMNFATQITGRLVFQKFPDVIFTAQRFLLPGVTVGFPVVGGPLTRTQMAPGSIQYQPMPVDFLILSDFSNYQTVVEWIQNSIRATNKEVFSDASIELMKNSGESLGKSIKIYDAFPNSVSMPAFDPTITAATPMTATMNLQYLHYEFA